MGRPCEFYSMWGEGVGANGAAVKLMFRLGGCRWRWRVRIRSSRLYESTTSICFSRNNFSPFFHHPFNRAAVMVIIRSGMVHLAGGFWFNMMMDGSLKR
jgi:hypothetical protein